MLYDVSHMFYIDFGDFPQSPYLLVVNSEWPKKPYVTILDFSGATGLEKRQGQGEWFTNFEAHPTSQSRPPGGQGGAIGAHHLFSIDDRVLQTNFGL
jgi:hypothetical protein